MVPKIQKASTKEQDNQGPNGGNEGSWVLDQLNLEGLNAWTAGKQQAAKDLLVDSTDVFSKNDLDLGKCVTNTNCICPRYTGEVTRHLSGPS